MFERAARGAALIAMAVLAARLWIGGSGDQLQRRARTGVLDSALVSWASTPPGEAIVDADSTLDRRQRDWLVALRRTGTSVLWTATDSAGSALVVEAGPLPESPARVSAVSRPGGAIILRDELGRVDSALSGAAGASSWRLASIGMLRALSGSSTATARARDSVIVRPVLVIGAAGWETKFVAAALEEAGWTIATRMFIAPGAVVRQGADIRIDTASYSAVVVLDSTSAISASDVSRFVNDGGGLIAAGAGASHSALQRLLPARGGQLTAELGALLGPTPREGLSARAFRVSDGAVAIDRRGQSPIVVGHRVGSGRVLAVGYDDTWRLRMAPPGESAPDAHRAWWSSLVSGVAGVRLVPQEDGGIDEAPFASTVAALGPPTTGTPDNTTPSWPWTGLLAALAAAAFLGEWLSRRLRGVA